MNKLVRGLLSGASLATLQLCVATVARASAPLIINAATGAQTVTQGQSPDYIEVTSTGDITGDLTNEGTVGLGSASNAEAGDGIYVQGNITGAIVNAASGVIHGTVRGIHITQNAAAGGGVSNAGMISVTNTSHTGGSHYASAIEYQSNATAAITNSGTIGVKVAVAGISNVADAYAYGVNVNADGGNARNIVETYTGTGAIGLSAAAHAHSANATVVAHAISGILQVGFDSPNISQSITNSGNISLAAKATATAAAGSGRAFAQAHTAIKQRASNNTAHAAGANFTQAITNDGTITLAATAVSHGNQYGFATAYAYDGIKQHAKNAQTISQTIGNTGNISLTANVDAAAATYEVDDEYAYAFSAIAQSASNHNLTANSTVTQSITNSGSISLAATLTDAAPHSAVYQLAQAYEGIKQNADNVAAVSQTISNTGNITLAAKIKASASAYEAREVYAYAGSALKQRAENSILAANTTITQSITNNGSISLAATGTASAAYYAGTVEVGADDALYQAARNATAISQTMDNTGNLSFTAKAKAVALTSYYVYYPEAYAEDEFSQEAQNASLAANSTISQSITNNGSIVLAATATAKAPEYAYDPYAYAEDAFYQIARKAQTISQSAGNGGAISLTAKAKAAVSKSGTAYYADASAADVFHQTASDSVFATNASISQSVTNSGTISLDANVSVAGFAYGYYGYGYAQDVVQQEARKAQAISQTIGNTGNISLTANAKGVAATGQVYDIVAFAGDIFVQGASNATTGANGTITQSIANDGSLTLKVSAFASAPKYATASASAEYLFYQEAKYAARVKQTIGNTGAIHIAGKIKALGQSYVRAAVSASNLFSQYANDVGIAVQRIDNSGTLTIGLKAAAANTATVDDIYATADALDLFQQKAQGTGTGASGGARASLSVTNSGSIAIAGAAKAKGGAIAHAYATASSIFYQSANDFKTISATATNSGTIDIALKANGGGGSDESTANADAGYLFDQDTDQNSNPDETVSLTAINSGAISVTATAAVTGADYQSVEAEFDNIFYQHAEDSGSATLSIANSATISVLMSANATGGTGDDIYAEAYGAHQNADDDLGSDSLSAANSGSITLHASAVASATGNAAARAEGEGFEQLAARSTRTAGATTPAGSAALSVTNTGTVSVMATGQAKGGLSLTVSAYATGVDQEIESVAGTASVNNSGTLDVSAAATGLPGTVGSGVTATAAYLPYVAASAAGITAIAEGTNGPIHRSLYFTGAPGTREPQSPAPLTLDVSNSGTVDVSATADGTAFAAANIFANAAGVAVAASSITKVTEIDLHIGSHYSSSRHQISAGGSVGGSVSNSGTIEVSASADGGIATAAGVTIGAGDIDATVTNAHGGLISVKASGATAVAVGIAEAGISYKENAIGYSGNSAPTSHAFRHTSHRTSTTSHGPAASVTGAITNSGTIDVRATAAGTNIGDGTDANEATVLPGVVPGVRARAEGIAINAETMAADILNAGTIDASAKGANAIANGIHVFAQIDGRTAHYTHSETYHSSVTGYRTVTGHGSSILHTVLANNTVTGKVTNSGTISVAASGKSAAAKGVFIQGGTLDSAVVNSGKIDATASGTGASAEGIVIAAAAIGSHGSVQNDGGTISATQNGVRGTAIDVSAAPDTLKVYLNGGSIYGNIVENAAGNAIVAGTGNTLLDGLINPSKNKIGSLTVAGGGELTLALNAAEGNASAYVATFTQNGKLAIEGGQDGSSGSIHAGAATLAGAAIVNLDLGGVAYGLDTTYKVVFSGAALSGTWSSVSPGSASAFFTAKGVYSANEADITLTRTPLNAIGGLTANQKSVAGALETIYDTSGGAGSLGPLLVALFQLSPAQYDAALDTLSGETVGELAQANADAAQSFLDQINDHLSNGGGGGGTASLGTSPAAMASNNPAPSGLAPSAVAPAQASTLSGTNVWGGGFQYGSNVDRTASGPAYSSRQSGLLAGIDVPVSPNVLLGIAGSYSTGDLKTGDFSSFGTFSAAQIAGYGRATAANGIYAQADVSYASFSNKLNRYVAIPGFAGSGTVHGKFDSNGWGAYGEAGWRFNPSDWAAASVTPYAAISYVDSHSGGFTETGFGVPLTIGSSSSRTTSSYLGLKLATDWDAGNNAIVTPRVTAAWQHDFNKNAWEVSAAFAAVPAVGYGVAGSDLSRDGAYLDGGVTVTMSDSVNVMLDYQGRFTSDRSDNAFLARANFKFW